MPTTLTGLLLFVALLLPGFIFVAIRHRGRPERRPSAFQETAAVVSASVAIELVVLIALVVLHAAAASWMPDFGQLITDPRRYLAVHYAEVFAWLVGALVVACLLAIGAGFASRGKAVHPSVMSSWWMLFDHWQQGAECRVQCELDDGSGVTGQLADWNTLGDDSPDRDLILASPIAFRPAGEAVHKPHPVSAVCVSARNIVTMFVAYSDPKSVSRLDLGW